MKNATFYPLLNMLQSTCAGSDGTVGGSTGLEDPG